MMESSNFPYFALIPLLVFGPLFFWILYSFGLRELFKAPAEIRERRRLEKEEAETQSASMRRKRARPQAADLTARRLSPLAWAGQAVTYGLFAAVIGYFAASPAYTFLGPDQALIKLSLSHPGKRKVECRKRSREELAKLSPNMRAPKSCPRERWPVLVELVVDGDLVYRQTGEPRGLSDDGASSFYKTFPVPAGPHRIALRVRDKGDSKGFDHTRESDVVLVPAQSLVVGFKAGNPAVFLK